MGYTYPKAILNYFKKKNLNLGFKEEDFEILKEGTVDYIGFSYYMSFVAADQNENDQKVKGNIIISNKNPYLESSELRCIDLDKCGDILNLIYSKV